MLIDRLPWSRAGPEVRPAFCVLRLDGGNFRNDRLRRAARIFRLRNRPANDEIIRPGGNGGGGRHRSFLAGSLSARWPDSRGHEDHFAPKTCAAITCLPFAAPRSARITISAGDILRATLQKWRGAKTFAVSNGEQYL